MGLKSCFLTHMLLRTYVPALLPRFSVGFRDDRPPEPSSVGRGGQEKNGEHQCKINKPSGIPVID